MNKLSIVLGVLSAAAFSAGAFLFFYNKDQKPEADDPAYVLGFSKKINSSVKTLTDGEKAYAITHDLRLFAFDKTGKPVFEKKLSKKSYPQAFAHDNGTIYIGTDDGDIIAVSGSDGAEIWSANVKEKIAGGFGFHKNLILFGAFDTQLHAFDTNGMQAFSLKSSDAINGRIEIKNGVAYFGNCAGEIEAVDISSRKSLWTAKIGSHIPLAPIGAGGALIVSDFQGSLTALDPSNGAALWKKDEPKAAVETQMEAYQNNFLFVDNEGGFHAASSESGAILKSIIPGQKRMELCMDGGMAAMALADGRVKIIDLAFFRVAFEFDLQIRIDSASVKNGLLAILDADSTLHVFLKNNETGN